jgi:hypothetical protein
VKNYENNFLVIILKYNQIGMKTVEENFIVTICFIIIFIIILKFFPFINQPDEYRYAPFWYCAENYGETKYSDIPWKCINYMHKY